MQYKCSDWWVVDECTDVPVDVEDTNEGVLFDVGDQGFINVLHNPVEELGVDMFGQGITGVGGLQAGEGLDICLCGCLQLPVAQPLRHVLVSHTYQLTERRQVAIVGLRQEKEIFIRGKPKWCQVWKRWILSFRLTDKTSSIIIYLDTCGIILPSQRWKRML